MNKQSLLTTKVCFGSGSWGFSPQSAVSIAMDVRQGRTWEGIHDKEELFYSWQPGNRDRERREQKKDTLFCHLPKVPSDYKSLSKFMG